MTSGVPPLAAGFASKFDEIGPYIGFGSLVAVVAMAVLVFAQGRELQRLREWAGTSPERLDALEQEVRAAAATPPLAPPPRPGYVVPGAVPVTAATAGAVAPPAPGAPPRPPGVTGTPGAPGAPGAANGPGTAAIPAPPGSPVVGAGAPRPTPPRPTPPGAPGAPATRVLASAAVGGPRAATPAGAAASSRDRDRGTGGPPRSIGQTIGVGVVGVVVLLALLFAFGVIGGSDDGPAGDTSSTAQADASGTTTGQTAPRYPPTEMKTLVLNASGSAGLAKDVSDSIEEKFRFPMGAAANYNSIPGGTDTSAVTMVFYRAGAGESVSQNRTAAQDVARFLKLNPVGRYVKRMPDPVKNGTSGQRVVVVVGADYARVNPPTGTATGGTATSPGGTGGTGGTATPGGTGTTGTTTGTGAADGTGGATTQPDDTGTSQLTPNTDLGPEPGVDDGTGGPTLP